MEEVILKTEGIVKTYNGNRVLNDLSMTINRGDIYGFVGAKEDDTSIFFEEYEELNGKPL